MEKVCPLCGKNFSPSHGNRKYCSAECSEKAHLNQACANALRRYYLKKRQKKNPKKPKRRYEKPSFNENIRKADECGLSYGKYMALVFMGKSYEEILTMQGGNAS